MRVARPRPEDLVGCYALRDQAAVFAFLKANSFLIPLLYAVNLRLKEFYFPDSEMALEIFVEPEAEDDEQLVISILADDPEGAEAALERFDNEWWLDNDEAQGKLCVTLEFRDEPVLVEVKGAT